MVLYGRNVPSVAYLEGRLKSRFYGIPVAAHARLNKQTDNIVI